MAWRWITRPSGARVQRFAPELEQRLRSHRQPTDDSWRVDETYVRVKGRWVYLYRAVDSSGATLDFLLSEQRDAAAAKRFLERVLRGGNHQSPRVINTDKHAGYPPAIQVLKEEGVLPAGCGHRAVKYLGQRDRAGSPRHQAPGESQRPLPCFGRCGSDPGGLRSHARSTQRPRLPRHQQETCGHKTASSKSSLASRHKTGLHRLMIQPRLVPSFATLPGKQVVRVGHADGQGSRSRRASTR